MATQRISHDKARKSTITGGSVSPDTVRLDWLERFKGEKDQWWMSIGLTQRNILFDACSLDYHPTRGRDSYSSVSPSIRGAIDTMMAHERKLGPPPVRPAMAWEEPENRWGKVADSFRKGVGGLIQ